MRLWSLHPCHLDTKGLLALWREGLLARAVLRNQTKGYRHHPQLERFRSELRPVVTINSYLWSVYDEAVKRGYHFNASKLGPKSSCSKLVVTAGQLRHEMEHLKAKLKIRDEEYYRKLKDVVKPRPHPMFKVKPGGIASWERIRERS